MAKISENTFAMILAMACIAVLFPTGLAQFTPATPIIQIPGLLPPVKGAGKCWLSLTNIPSCRHEIYRSLSSGQVSKIGSACCHAINQVSHDCWPKMFPFHPFFPPLLKNFCAAPSPAPDQTNAASKLSVPSPTVYVTQITGCWSSITSTEGCASDIYKSLTSGQINAIDLACCKAVADISDNCWPKMFPFSPFFLPLLKSNCEKLTGAAPAPKAV